MISVVTPAHNEEQFIERCLESVRIAAAEAKIPVEHIVVLNRCTDRTPELAESYGAKIVREDARNLSTIRNAGVAVAQGEFVVTIDADSWMSTNMLAEVARCLNSGRFIGGGVRIYPERLSLGIVCSVSTILPLVWMYGVSAGLFWFRKSDFDAIGGFDSRLTSVEDLDFGRRLKRFGRTKGMRYGTIRTAHIITSCRKFDQFGDWYLALRPWITYNIIRGEKNAVDKFYYDVRS